MSRARTAAAACFAALFAIALPAAAQDQIATCVVAQSDDGDDDGLARLVRSEIDRHASHRAALTDCNAHLKVELIRFQGQRYLTGRLGTEVPHRVHVDGNEVKDVEKALTELLRVVLGNDPVVLRAPGGQSWFTSRLEALRKSGHNTFGVALVQSVTFVEGSADFDPGIALSFAREIEHLQLGLGAAFAMTPEQETPGLTLDALVRLYVQVDYFFDADGDVSPFVSSTLGLLHQRYSGPRPADLGGGGASFDVTGGAAGLRVGVELFRTTTTRFSLFAEGVAPMFASNDKQSEIVSGYAPSLWLGTGVHF